MQRKWRVGRLLLAVLWLSMGCIVFYSWPMGPRWRIDAEQPVGFGLKQGVLLTLPDRELSAGDRCEVHGYDLATGEKRLSHALELEGQTSELLNRLQGILSSNGDVLACFDNATSIQVFDLKQQCQRMCCIRTEVLNSVALSTDGETLALLKDFKRVEVRNSRTGQIKQQFKMPSEAGQIFAGNFSCKPENMQFSSDGHYLAVGTVGETVAIFDLHAGQLVGLCPHGEIPQFLADKNVLVTTPRIYATGKAQWFELDALTIKELPLSQLRDNELQGLASSPSRLLTFCWDRSTRQALPQWIPDAIRKKLESIWGWKRNRYFVESIDACSGQVRDTFFLRVDTGHPALMSNDAIVSTDGLLLAIKGERELCLWDIPPRRSATSYLVCCGMTVLALWLAWPRRVKAIPGADSTNKRQGYEGECNQSEAPQNDQK